MVSEIAKRSDKLGSLISSLPIMTMLVLFWLFVENASTQKIGNHAYYTFWYVLGSLPFFVIFPYLLPKLGFGLAMGGVGFGNACVFWRVCVGAWQGEDCADLTKHRLSLF